MRIKRLEICGFKSFVDRTILTFPDPITAVQSQADPATHRALQTLSARDDHAQAG